LDSKAMSKSVSQVITCKGMPVLIISFYIYVDLHKIYASILNHCYFIFNF
jgi:hypothetical protein